jgi:hypothetical protein
MNVGDSLPGNGAIIDADVVVIGVEFGIDGLLGSAKQAHQSQCLFIGQVKVGRHVALRDNQRMSWVNWKDVTNGHAELVLVDDAGRWQGAKYAGFGHCHVQLSRHKLKRLLLNFQVDSHIVVLALQKSELSSIYMLFVSRTRSLAMILVVAGGLGGFLSAPSAQTQACPTKPAEHERWYSPVANNLADKAPTQCADCADPANHADSSCIVYRILRSEDCRDGHCGNEQGEFWLNWREGYAVQQSLRYQHPFKYILDAGSNCWFLVWALDPVIGVEHAGRRDTVNFWRAGFIAATQSVSPPIPEQELGMLIQPAHRRSQHQLHIHLGRIPVSYRLALDELDLGDQTVREVSINGHPFFVRYLADLPGKQALDGHRVFDEVAAMIPGGEAAMPLFGVLVVRAKGDEGSWVMAAEGVTRRELDFSYDQACRLDPGLIR